MAWKSWSEVYNHYIAQGVNAGAAAAQARLDRLVAVLRGLLT